MNTPLWRTVALLAGLAFGASTAQAGNVRIGISSMPPKNGNPFGTPARTTWYTIGGIYDTLTKLGSDTTPQASLALSWRNTDEKTWLVSLRPNVTFSNGEPMDAAAVVATVNYLKTPAAAVDLIAQEVANIETVRAVDKLTVEFKTKAIDPNFARQLTLIPIVPPVAWAKVGRDGFALSPIGTGPFQVEKWEKNRVTFVPFKGSWHPPAADRLEVIALPEQAARQAALLSGRIDIASEMGLEDIDSLKEAGFKIYQRPASSVYVMMFNSLKPNSPFKDLRVRQALNYAVNRDAIAKTIYHGLVPAATQTASRNNPDHDPALKYFPYDPEKAKALLKDAGYPNGFSFTDDMSFGTSGPELPQAMQQIASDLAKVGVKMEIRQLPWAQWVRGVQETGVDGDAFNFEYETLPTGDTLRPYRLHSCTWPHAWYCDKEIMPLLDEAKITFDPARRKALVKQILTRQNEQAPGILLFEPQGIDGVGPKVENYNQENAQMSYSRMNVTK